MKEYYTRLSDILSSDKSHWTMAERFELLEPFLPRFICTNETRKVDNCYGVLVETIKRFVNLEKTEVKTDITLTSDFFIISRHKKGFIFSRKLAAWVTTGEDMQEAEATLETLKLWLVASMLETWDHIKVVTHKFKRVKAECSARDLGITVLKHAEASNFKIDTFSVQQFRIQLGE